MVIPYGSSEIGVKRREAEPAAAAEVDQQRLRRLGAVLHLPGGLRLPGLAHRAPPLQARAARHVLRQLGERRCVPLREALEALEHHHLRSFISIFKHI